MSNLYCTVCSKAKIDRQFDKRFSFAYLGFIDDTKVVRVKVAASTTQIYSSHRIKCLQFPQQFFQATLIRNVNWTHRAHGTKAITTTITFNN